MQRKFKPNCLSANTRVFHKLMYIRKFSFFVVKKIGMVTLAAKKQTQQNFPMTNYKTNKRFSHTSTEVKLNKLYTRKLPDLKVHSNQCKTNLAGHSVQPFKNSSATGRKYSFLTNSQHHRTAQRKVCSKKHSRRITKKDAEHATRMLVVNGPKNGSWDAVAQISGHLCYMSNHAPPTRASKPRPVCTSLNDQCTMLLMGEG